MKTLTKIIFPGIAVFLVVFVLVAQQKDAFTSRSQLELMNMQEKYGDKVLMALYSIDDIRPFMIMSVDKVLEKYNKDWLCPSKIVSLLEEEDKTLAYRKAVEFIDGIKDISKRKVLLNKIGYWCMSRNQLDFIKSEFGYANSDLFYAARNIKATMDMPEFDAGLEMTPKNSEKGLVTLNNTISNMSMKQQIRFYGEIYWKLSEIENR
jgi:hypothetical protein